MIVYVVRGSGELPQKDDARSYGATWDAFDPIDPETGGSSIDASVELDKKSGGGSTVDTHTPFLYDLVEKVHERVGGQTRLSWAPIRYPAIPVESGSYPAKGWWLVRGYPNSVTSGIRELHRTLKRQWEICGTRTRYVLAGYSQGADVVNSYLRGKVISVRVPPFGTPVPVDYLGPTPEIMGQIASVALIADPNHDPRDPESYSDVDGRLAQKGGQAGYRIGVPKQVASLTDSICLAGDPVCGQGTTAHPERDEGDLIHTGGYRNFVNFPVACDLGAGEETGDESAVTCMADRIVSRLGVRNLVRHPLDEAASAPGTTGRDVAFFIDTTGSMQDDIDSALAFARSEADRIIALDGRVALVQYRDVGDATPAEIVTPFTSDQLEFQAGLATLFADGGDDVPEGLLHALMLGFDDLEWQFGASKAAVVLTDATFHEPDLTGGETLPQVERRSLEIDPVNVFPVVDVVGRYEDLAARTSGQVISKADGDTEQALREALDSIAERPSAVLSNSAYYAAPGREIHFDASASSAVTGGIAEYRWDFDGDGFSDEVTTTPSINHTYPSGYAGVMQVLVVDDGGRSANASASVLVDEGPQPGLVPRVPSAAGMSARASVVAEHVEVKVTWQIASSQPERWVVAVDGDPVSVVDGKDESTELAVDYQDEPWAVSVTPMDADGNLGPAYAAQLDPVGRQASWYARPLVWISAVVAGLLAFVLVGWWFGRRRARLAGSGGTQT